MSLIGTRKPLLGNVLKHEYSPEHGFCREMATFNIAGGADLLIGTVVAVVAGKFVALNPAADTGAEIAAGIVIENKTVGDAVDTAVATLVRGPAVVGRDALVFPEAATAPQKAAAEAQLEALGIIVRAQV